MIQLKPFKSEDVENAVQLLTDEKVKEEKPATAKKATTKTTAKTAEKETKKTVVITGASKGIGAHMAIYFAPVF